MIEMNVVSVAAVTMVRQKRGLVRLIRGEGRRSVGVVIVDWREERRKY
jgi:hypothetical protein